MLYVGEWKQNLLLADATAAAACSSPAMPCIW